MSVAVGIEVISAEHSPVTSGSEATSATGAFVSFTFTVKLQPLWLPALSVAVQLSGVVPSGKVEPEAGEQPVVITPPQLSEAVASKEAGAPFGPVHSAVWLSGQVMLGGVLSLTVTFAEQESEAALLSVTVK